MKKLLLLTLVPIGLALIPAKKADAEVSVGVGLGYRDNRTGKSGVVGCTAGKLYR